MILTLLGWFYIITGIIFLFQPEKMRSKFRKMEKKQLKILCFWLALVIGLLLIIGTWGIPGLLAKIFLVFGFIGVLKAIFYLKAKAADELLDWWLQKDVKFFRTIAVVQIVVGGLILSI